MRASCASSSHRAIRYRRSTDKLQTLGKLEGFVRRPTAGYRTHLRAFEFVVDEIPQQARRKNVEGVALGFNQLTLGCVNCHRQLRRAAVAAAATAPSPSGN
jgi:hypothetical protein